MKGFAFIAGSSRRRKGPGEGERCSEVIPPRKVISKARERGVGRYAQTLAI